MDKEYCDCKETRRFEMPTGGVMCFWVMDINYNIGCIVCNLPVKLEKTNEDEAH